ncbi:MAG: hypothetical protein D6762_07930 [Candidatus Neomarinimicrobiota bacterium]|nr:MAG: hypothetical protein D6762_07930 [Candidatus Neomarinimicrobiota bacterium]
MKTRIVLLGIFCLSLGYGDVVRKDACYTCHQVVDEDRDDDAKIMTHIDQDIHLQVGLSCADCHGGDPTAFDDPDAAMWDNDDFLGAIERGDQPEVCGKCHSDPQFMRQYTASVRTDEVQQYWTSQHGKLLQQGDEHVAVCTSCHGVHGILKKDDPRSPVYATHVPETCNRCHGDADTMAGYGIPTDQYQQYKTSVHGKALLENNDIGAPACNDCHGNHGAMPPNVVTIADICGTCHVNNRQLFVSSHLNYDMLNVGAKQCIECHGNHGIQPPSEELLHAGTKTFVCQSCHDLHGEKAAVLATQMDSVIDSLKRNYDQARALISTAEQKGMEVSDLYEFLDEAHRSLMQTRTSIHSFNIQTVRETAGPGMKASTNALEGARRSLQEYDRRRWSLFFMTLAASFLVVILILKIRNM